MLGPIAKLPAGLLDVFGLRTRGEYPRNVAEQIVPTYDLGTLINSIFNSEVWTGEIELLGSGQTAGPHSFTPILETPADLFAVPGNEYWLINEWEMQLTMFETTNECGPIALGYQRQNSLGLAGFESFPRDDSLVNPSILYTGGAVTGISWSIAKGQRPWILGPRAIPSALFMGEGNVRGSSGNATNVQVKLYYTPMRA